MSASQFWAVSVIGATTLALGQLVYQAAFPDPAIQFRSLTYANGLVTVDRTVKADGSILAATKLAEVIAVETGERVCQGTAEITLNEGHRIGQVSLSEWSGDDNCNPLKLPPGKYQLRAVYVVGDEQYPVDGAAFALPEVWTGR